MFSGITVDTEGNRLVLEGEASGCRVLTDVTDFSVILTEF